MGRLARKPAESLIVAAWLLLPIMLTAYGDGNRGSVAGSPVTASSTAASSASRTINDSSVDSDVKNGTNTTTTDGYDNVNATSATGNGTEYVVRKGNYTCIKKRARAFTKKITQRTTFKINMRKAERYLKMYEECMVPGIDIRKTTVTSPLPSTKFRTVYRRGRHRMPKKKKYVAKKRAKTTPSIIQDEGGDNYKPGKLR